LSIRARIFLVFVAAVGAGFGLLAYWVTGELRARYSESFEEVLVDSSRLLAEQLAADWQQPEQTRFTALRAAMERLKAQQFSAPINSLEKTSADIRIYVTDVDGALIFDSRPGSAFGEDYSQWHDVARTLQGGYGARTTDEPLTDAHDVSSTVSVAYVAAPILIGGKVEGVVTIGKPKTNIQRFIDKARSQLLGAVLVASLVAIMLALLLYIWVSRPLQALVDYARAVSAGQPAVLPVMGDNEIGRVGAAMDSMRRALLDKEYVESYVQSLTHEVKSPLTAIRASAELLSGDVTPERRAAFVGNIEREVDRLSDISDRLLELASLERADRLSHAEAVDCFALAREVCGATQAVAVARGIKLDESYAGMGAVVGDGLLLKQAIDNLLRNALDFSPAGGTISLRGVEEPGGVSLTISDEGPGIPDYARERIFERFYSLPRPGSGRKSTGLGLNFVREVVQLHGGSITINCPERGTQARLFVPRRPPGGPSPP
jgi:two-component system sensor histidine kinase CreC